MQLVDYKVGGKDKIKADSLALKQSVLQLVTRTAKSKALRREIQLAGM